MRDIIETDNIANDADQIDIREAVHSIKAAI